jgi:hypothetical protein
MATVRMADYLRHEIVRKFEDLYDKSNPVKEISTHVGDKVYDIFLGSKINDFMDAINKDFKGLIKAEDLFITNNEININLNLMQYRSKRQEDKTYKVEEFYEEDVTITVPLSSEMSQLKKVDGWRDEGVILNLEATTIPDHAQMYIDKIKKVTQEESKRLAKKRADCEKVETALDGFTTLNQALKAWPALSKLVSKEKIAKVHEKQQRKRKEQQQRSKIEPIEPGLNQTILTATLLGDD